MGMYYILEGHEIKEVDDAIIWAKWFEKIERRHVANGVIGDSQISTVFLGLNHSFKDGPSLIFETLVFGGVLDGEMERYSTWDEAESGHKLMIERVKIAEMRRHKLTWKQKIIWTIIILTVLLAGSVETRSPVSYEWVIQKRVILMEKVRYFKEVVLGRTE